MSFTYDAFISYAAEDRDWAVRLGDDLSKPGRKIFVDQKYIRAGDEWEESLQDAIEQSQHMIVLCSHHSEKSRWVDREVTIFRALTRGPKVPPRRIIPVILDMPLSSLRGRKHHVNDIDKAGKYPGDPMGLDPAVWAKVLDKLGKTMGSADNARSVPVLVVTSTADALRADADREIQTAVGEDVTTLREFADSIAVDLETLLLRYGTDRSDWQPFGSGLTARGILEVLKDKINTELTAAGLPRFRWEHLADDFWGGATVEVSQRLASEPCLIVLDPVALYDQKVLARMTGLLFRIRDNGDAVLLVLSPFEMPATLSAVRKTISELATDILDRYHSPPVFLAQRYARYMPSIGDELDLKASLLSGLGPFLASGSERRGNTFTSTGS